MYIEISPRRAGKTTRLMRAMQQCITMNDGIPVLFTPSITHGHDLLANHSDGKLRESIHVVNTKTTWEHLIRGKKDSEHFIPFIDEFDMFKPYNMAYVQHGYYAGTPTKVRTLTDIIRWRLGEVDDILLTLLSCNDGMHVAYSNISSMMNMSIDSLADMRASYAESRYESEMCGHWSKV